MKQQLNIHVNENLKNRLESEAEEKHLSRSALARMILSQNLPEA